MGVAEEILVLIKYSPKRENVLGCIKEQVEFKSEPEEKSKQHYKTLTNSMDGPRNLLAKSNRSL